GGTWSSSSVRRSRRWPSPKRRDSSNGARSVAPVGCLKPVQTRSRGGERATPARTLNTGTRKSFVGGRDVQRTGQARLPRHDGTRGYGGPGSCVEGNGARGVAAASRDAGGRLQHPSDGELPRRRGPDRLPEGH